MTALAFSLNTISVQLAVAVGLDRIIEIMRGFGITSPIPRHISISLGTPDLTLLEVAGRLRRHRVGRPPRHAAVLRSRHRHRRPRRRGSAQHAARPAGHLARGRLRDDQPDEGRRAARHRALRARARPPRRRQDRHVGELSRRLVQRLHRPTSSCSVWIGRDDSTPIGDKITGGGAAVPIWLDFMQKAHPRTPVRDFPVPPERQLRARRAVERRSVSAGLRRGVDAVRARHPARQVPRGPPIRSFDDLVPAPALPAPSRSAHRCRAL